MSNLKSRLAGNTEYQKTEDGYYIDPETGEQLDNPPVDKDNQSWESKMRSVMYEQKKLAKDEFTDDKYYNKWGKVSPINIIFVDNIGQLYSMDPKSASDAVINIIQSLNNTYGNDETYDYISQSYLNELKMNMDKKKSIDKIIEYLTNVYFQGIGMGTGNKRRASFASNDMLAINLTDKKQLEKIMIGLNALSKVASKYNGIKYDIVAGGGITDVEDFKSTNDPKEAIKMWCELQQAMPMNVSIIAQSAASVELINWAKANKEEIQKMIEESGVDKIYKTEYILNSIDRSQGVPSSYDEYGGDQIDPFSMG